jgi:hypothetical protein
MSGTTPKRTRARDRVPYLPFPGNIWHSLPVEYSLSYKCFDASKSSHELHRLHRSFMASIFVRIRMHAPGTMFE